MRPLRCIAVDDEPLAVSMIEKYVERTPDIDMVSSFTDPVMALSKIKETKPDVVFLDIQMPDLNGLELSRMIPKNTRIVFTTAFKEYALDGYEVSAIDYLLKPIRYQKFVEAVEKVRQWVMMKEASESSTKEDSTDNPDFIYVKVDKVLQKVMLSDILYVEGMKDYVMIHVANSRYPLMVHITMKGMEDMLPKNMFMRVHRSYVISLDKIDSVQPGMDIMIGKDVIHVSDAYKEDFAKYLEGKSV